MTQWSLQSAVGLRDAIANGEVTAERAMKSTLDRIAQFDPKLGSYLQVENDAALEQAAVVDRARKDGRPLGLLAGVPVAIKDNMCTRGVPTTCASRILEGWRPPYDAHVVQRLREAGAIVVGKANLDEFAMGSSNENSAYGVVRNPWNPSYTPGGSSGGSAAAVAAGLATVGLGSDTGGSVRQPAALCGVTAIRPTYGSVSRYGLVAFASSLDQIGPIGRSVRDTARVLDVIAGHDPRDSTSVARASADHERACAGSAKGLRVGVLTKTLEEGTADSVSKAVHEAIEVLRGLGCEIVPVELPHAHLSVSIYYLIAASEASSNLARFDGVRFGLRVARGDVAATYCATRAEGFGPEVKRRIMLGTYALSAGYYDAFYVKAQRARARVVRDYEEAFAQCDVVLSPTSPTPAFRLGEKVSDPIAMYLADIFTLPASLAGLPAISIPCGFSPDGLPIGLQLAAPAFEEPQLFRLAAAYEAATDWSTRHPPLN